MMLILVLLGMYFDALVVFVTSQTLLFRLALAILWQTTGDKSLLSYYIYCGHHPIRLNLMVGCSKKTDIARYIL